MIRRVDSNSRIFTTNSVFIEQFPDGTYSAGVRIRHYHLKLEAIELSRTLFQSSIITHLFESDSPVSRIRGTIWNCGSSVALIEEDLVVAKLLLCCISPSSFAGCVLRQQTDVIFRVSCFECVSLRLTRTGHVPLCFIADCLFIVFSA
jgi:hypothetical protein